MPPRKAPSASESPASEVSQAADADGENRHKYLAAAALIDARQHARNHQPRHGDRAQHHSGRLGDRHADRGAPRCRQAEPPRNGTNQHHRHDAQYLER